MGKSKDNFEDFGLNVGMEDEVQNTLVQGLETLGLPFVIREYVLKTVIWKTAFVVTGHVLDVFWNTMLAQPLSCLGTVIEKTLEIAYESVKSKLKNNNYYDLTMDTYTKYWLCSYTYNMVQLSISHDAPFAFPDNMSIVFAPDSTNPELVDVLAKANIDVHDTGILIVSAKKEEDQGKKVTAIDIKKSKRCIDYEALFLSELPNYNLDDEVTDLVGDLVEKLVVTILETNQKEN